MEFVWFFTFVTGGVVLLLTATAIGQVVARANAEKERRRARMGSPVAPRGGASIPAQRGGAIAGKSSTPRSPARRQEDADDSDPIGLHSSAFDGFLPGQGVYAPQPSPPPVHHHHTTPAHYDPPASHDSHTMPTQVEAPDSSGGYDSGASDCGGGGDCGGGD